MDVPVILACQTPIVDGAVGCHTATCQNLWYTSHFLSALMHLNGAVSPAGPAQFQNQR